MPNRPRYSLRTPSSTSTFELRPTVARNSSTSAAVSPTPLSWIANTSRPSSTTGSMSTRAAGAAESNWRRAVVASTAFCSSSRR